MFVGYSFCIVGKLLVVLWVFGRTASSNEQWQQPGPLFLGKYATLIDPSEKCFASIVLHRSKSSFPSRDLEKREALIQHSLLPGLEFASLPTLFFFTSPGHSAARSWSACEALHFSGAVSFLLSRYVSKASSSFQTSASSKSTQGT